MKTKLVFFGFMISVAATVSFSSVFARPAPLVIDDYSARDLARRLRDTLKQSGKSHSLVVYEGNEAMFLIVPNPQAKPVTDISDEPSIGSDIFYTEHRA